MAAPVAPNLSSLVTEGLNKAGYTTPSTTLITRASDKWMQEIKADIVRTEKRLSPLYKTTYTILAKGKHRYSLPSDYLLDLNLTILDGTQTGALQTASANTATLEATEDVAEDTILGKYILITSGTGINSCSQCTAYNTTTKVATVSHNWSTTPIAGDGYLIVETYYPLEPESVSTFDSITASTVKGRPSYFSLVSNSDYILYKTPDKTYGLQTRYYSDLTTIDLAGTLMTSLYNRWQTLWVQGVLAKALEDIQDARVDTEMQKYLGMLQATVLQDTDSRNILQGDFINPDA